MSADHAPALYASIRGVVLIAGLLAVAGICYWFGAFSTSFNDGLCYSELHARIVELTGQVALAGDTALRDTLDKSVVDLPFTGYETSCEQVSDAWNKQAAEIRAKLPPAMPQQTQKPR